MSLFDVDTSNNNRQSPAPNKIDEISADSRMSHGTLSTMYRTPDQDAVPRLVFKNGMLVSYDSNNLVSSLYAILPQISLTPIFIIAKTGKDVFVDVLGINRPDGI